MFSRFVMGSDMNSIDFRILFVVALLGLASTGSALVQSARSDSTQAVDRAARAWLQHVDAGAWTAAWSNAASLLTDSLSEDEWEERGRAVRATLGATRSRRLLRAQFRDGRNEGTVDRPFALLQYRSEFATGLYLETILVVWDEGTWLVGGYEIAPMARGVPGR